MRVGSVKSGSNAEASTVAGRWYRQPILWFGGLIFATLLAGTAVTVIVASRFADQALSVEHVRVLATPIDRAAVDDTASDPASEFHNQDSSAGRDAPQ
jgi:hypothetical protein